MSKKSTLAVAAILSAAFSLIPPACTFCGKDPLFECECFGPPIKEDEDENPNNVKSD